MDEELKLLHALHLPANVTMWVGLAFALYITARVSVETSQSIEKILGPLGRRWANARDQRIARATESQRLSDEVRLQKTIIASKDREIEFLKAASDGQRITADMRRQILQLDAALSELRRYNEVTYSYILYDTNWHRTANLVLDPNCDTLKKIPTHMSFLDFEEQYHRSHGTRPYDPLAALAGYSDLPKKDRKNDTTQ